MPPKGAKWPNQGKDPVYTGESQMNDVYRQLSKAGDREKIDKLVKIDIAYEDKRRSAKR